MSHYDLEEAEDKRLTTPSESPAEELRNLTGINKEQEGAMDREAHNGASEDIAEREKIGYDRKKPKPAKDESDSLAEKTSDDPSDDDGFFKDDGQSKKGRFRGKITPKRAAGGVAGVLGLGSIAGILMISSGPLAFIHMGNLLGDFHFGNNEEFTNGRLSRIYRYVRGTGYRNNLGRVGNKFADKIDARLGELGITPEYNSRGLSHFDFDTSNPKAAKALDNMRTRGYDPVSLDTSGEGKIFRLEADINSRSGRAATRTMFGDLRAALDEDKIANAVTGRIANKRYAGGFHPLRNFVRDNGEKLKKYIQSVVQAHQERAKTGIFSPRSPPKTPDEISADQSRAARAAADETGGDAPKVVGDGEIPTIKANLKKIFAITAGVVGLAEIACNLDQIGNGIQQIRQAEVVLPMMRMGLDAISISSQLQAGVDVNSEEVGALFTQFVGQSDGAGLLSAFSADSIQAELGNQQIGERTKENGDKVKPAELPSSSKPGRDKPAFFNGIDTIINSIDSVAPPGFSGDDLCDLLTYSVGPFSVADAIDGVLTVVTDGGWAAVADGIVAVAFSVGGILGSDFFDSFAHWIAGAALQCAAGAQWGSCLNYGARLAANDQALGSGGRELSDIEELALDNHRKDLEQYDMKTKSLYARYIDPKETNSLFATAVFNNPRFFASSSTLAYALQTPLQNFGNIIGNFGNLFGGRTKALSSSYDYGFPEFGFSLDEQNDSKYEDPFKVAKSMEKNDYRLLKQMNEEYGECFKTTISESGTIQTDDAIDYSELPDKCNDKSNVNLTKYRFYIADTLAAKAGACYEGADEGACTELGFAEPTSSSGDTTNNGELPTGTVGPEDIEDILPWLGEGRGCHKSIAGRTRQMLKAAEDDGTPLTGSCWRSSEQQIALRQKNCPDPVNSPSSDCSPPTAKPGTSNHEKGLAIDFDNCGSRSTDCYIWLNAHAAEYGFQNLPSESWHWSVDGR